MFPDGFFAHYVEIGLTHYLVVAAVLFCTGLFTMMTKRNAIGILIGVELVLNSASVNLVAFDRYLGPGRIDGQIMALFIIVLAAAEAASRWESASTFIRISRRWTSIRLRSYKARVGITNY